MKEFSYTTIQELKADLEDAFKQLSLIHGLSFQFKGLKKQNENLVSCSVEFQLGTQLFSKELKYAGNFKKEFGNRINLLPHPKYPLLKLSDLHRQTRNGSYALIGFNNRNGKFKFMIRNNSSSIIFKVSYSWVVDYFELK